MSQGEILISDLSGELTFPRNALFAVLLIAAARELVRNDGMASVKLELA